MTPAAASLVVLVFGSSGLRAQSECSVVAGGPVNFSAPQIHHMTVRSGSACSFNFATARLANEREQLQFFRAIRITRRAQHGVAGTNDVSRYAYRPKPGFIGRDSFEVTITGEGVRSEGTATITVDVDVVP